MRKVVRLLGVSTAIMLLTSSLVSAAPSKQGKESYLVGLQRGASAAALAEAGVDVSAEWPEIGAAAVMATPAQAKALAKNPNVEYVEEDLLRYATAHGSLPYADGADTWGLQAVHAPEAWDALGHAGEGIKVCVLDTGIDEEHPEFYQNGVSILKGVKNFSNSRTAFDVDGHGTHVAGTVAGQLTASGSAIGTAPDVELYIGKVLGDDGSGRSSWILKGVDWCANTVGADIISMSLGGGRFSKTEDRAYAKHYNQGTLIIAAAGNDGNTAVSYPAGYDSVVSVAAIDQNLARASFSQYNADVELAGPGVATLSSVPQGTGVMGSAAEDGAAYTRVALEFSGHGDVTGQLVECGLADSTASCADVPAEGPWIALVDRGGITFAEKHANAAAQGASAMILANNDTANPADPGSFTLGSAGTYLPSVSVSYSDGVSIRDGGLGTATVSVFASDYAYYQGTSMATPHVSAVAALAWSANPALSNAEIRQVLIDSAEDLGASGRDDEFGYGLVQADAAVDLAGSR